MMWDGNGPWAHPTVWESGGWLMGIGMIAVIAIAVALVVVLVRGLYRQAPTAAHGQHQATAGGQYAGQYGARPPATPQSAQSAVQARTETARDIVQRRYASGEIDRDEYLRKLADL